MTTTDPSAPVVPRLRRPRLQFSLLIAIFMLLSITALVVVVPFLPGFDPNKQSLFFALEPAFQNAQDPLGTDALGRAGTSGYIDSKWFERFAGAVFFSLFEDAKQIYIARDDARQSQRLNGNVSGDIYNIGAQGTLSQLSNTGSTTKSIVEEMLKQGSQLKPSLYKNQGEVIKIFVARDVDFSTVYELRPAASSAAATLPALAN